jgi:hypothetical protein
LSVVLFGEKLGNSLCGKWTGFFFFFFFFFENSVKNIKREVDKSWRKLHNDEVHCLYSSPNIVRVIKARRLRWAGHEARTGEGRGVYKVLDGKT